MWCRSGPVCISLHLVGLQAKATSSVQAMHTLVHAAPQAAAEHGCEAPCSCLVHGKEAMVAW